MASISDQATGHSYFGCVRLTITILLLSLLAFALIGDFSLYSFVQNLKANESLSDPRIQDRALRQYGQEITWKTFFRHPLVEQLGRRMSIPMAGLIYPYFTADQITVFAVLIAISSYFFMKSKSFAMRWMAVWLLLVREFLDVLDGDVARQRALNSNSKGIKSETRTSSTINVNTASYGYYIDGIADSVAILVFAIVFHLKRRPRWPWSKQTDAVTVVSDADSSFWSSPSSSFDESEAEDKIISEPLIGGRDKGACQRLRHLFPVLEFLICFLATCTFYNKSIDYYKNICQDQIWQGSQTPTPIIQSATFVAISHSWAALDPAFAFVAAVVANCYDLELCFCRFFSRKVFPVAIILEILTLAHTEWLRVQYKLS